MHYEEKIFRPWPEANSLLIQPTAGCTNNKCTFCNMFRDKKFRVREIEGIFEDIDQAREYATGIDSIFLIDGNVLVLETEILVKVLNAITATFPECAKISLYAGLNDLQKKSVEDLNTLRRA